MRPISLIALCTLAACSPQSSNQVTANGSDSASVDETAAVTRRGADTPAPLELPSPQPTVDNRSSGRYRCMDGNKLTANFDPDNRRLTVVRAGKKPVLLTMQRVPSGLLYVAPGYEWRAKGEVATFSEPGLPPVACKAIR
jgi:membrane-bound inhibitor of C-type lysozyme